MVDNILKIVRHPLSNGVYTALVKNPVDGILDTKTFYPNNWSPKKISRMIDLAIKKHIKQNKKSLLVEQWVGELGGDIKDLVLLRIAIQPYGNSYIVATAFPIYVQFTK